MLASSTTVHAPAPVMAVRSRATYIRVPTTKLLTQELTSITKDWFTLGIHLGVDIAELHSIEVQHSINLNRCKVEMFNTWIKGSQHASVSWESVAVALEELSEHKLADNIRDKYLVPMEGQLEEVCISSRDGIGSHLARMESELAKNYCQYAGGGSRSSNSYPKIAKIFGGTLENWRNI